MMLSTVSSKPLRRPASLLRGRAGTVPEATTTAESRGAARDSEQECAWEILLSPAVCGPVVYNCLNQLPCRTSTDQNSTRISVSSFMEHVSHASVPPFRARDIARSRPRSSPSSVSAFGQTGQPSIASLAAAASAGAGRADRPTSSRRLSIDEAVKLALEQNLGIRIQRIDPQIQDIGIAQARSFWAPSSVVDCRENSQTQQSDQRAVRRRHEHSATAQVRDRRRHQPDAAVGRQLHGELAEQSGSRRPTSSRASARSSRRT